MAKKISNFWNFFIQFFVVILGVLITFWFSSISENRKERRAIRTALVQIQDELYSLRNEWSDNRKKDLEHKRDLITWLGNYREDRKADSIKMTEGFEYISHIVIHLDGDTENIALRATEASGLLNKIDSRLLYDIYTAQTYNQLLSKLNRETEELKLEIIASSLSFDDLKTLSRYHETNYQLSKLTEFWDRVLTYSDLLNFINRANLNYNAITNAYDLTVERIDKAIESIDIYLENKLEYKSNVPRGTN